MTKKDYELIAFILRSLRESLPKKTWDNLVQKFTEEFWLRSRVFDPQKFLAACREVPSTEKETD